MRGLIKKLAGYKIIRYSIGGGIAAMIDLGCLRLFSEVLGVHYQVSAIGAFVISFSFGYRFQKYITFRNYSQKHILHGSLFLLFQLIGQGLYMGLLWIGVDKLGIYLMYVAIIAKGIVFVRNYVSNNYFNFKK